MTIDENTETDGPSSLLVQAAIHLPGIRRGAVGEVDPRVPYIRGCLERGFLVPVRDEPSTAAEEPTAKEDPAVEEELPVVPDETREYPADDDDDVG